LLIGSFDAKKNPGRSYDNLDDPQLAALAMAKIVEQIMAITNDVTGFSFKLSKGEAESDPVLLDLTVSVSGSFEHLNSISFLFWPVHGDQTWATAFRVPGTSDFSASIKLSPYARSGSYEVRVFNLLDVHGDKIDVTSEQLRDLGFNPVATLANPYSDETPPQIDAISVSEVSENADGTFSVSVRLSAHDSHSGLKTGTIVEFTTPGGDSRQEWGYFSESGEAQFNFHFGKYSPTGFYKINTVRMYDFAGNSTLYYKPEDHGGVSGFQINNLNGDAKAPTLEQIDVSGYFDAETGRPTLRYEIKWADDVSGVNQSYLRVYLPNGGQNDRWLSVSDGRSIGTLSLLSPSAEGSYRLSPFAIDAAGNRSTWYSAEQLETLGFAGTVRIFAPDEGSYGAAAQAEIQPTAMLATEETTLGSQGILSGAVIRSGDEDAIIFGLHKDDYLYGGIGDDQLLGGAGDDHASGGGGNDFVDGGAGDDTMAGGTGDDTYRVDSLADIVTEVADEGVDAVHTSVGSRSDFTQMYTLPAFVENLVGTAAAAQGVYGNGLDNVITMGDGGDLIVLADAVNYTAANAGNDTIVSGGGNDFIFFGGSFNNGDKVDGGAGYDSVGVLGNVSINFEADDLVSIEKLAAFSSGDPAKPSSATFKTVDANVAAGQNLMVFAQSFRAGERLVFDGSAETDGTFNIRGGWDSDTLTGGAGADQIYGNKGADLLKGGAGADSFEYYDAAESTFTGRDTILDFSMGDRINLINIDADGDAANGNSTFNWIGSAAFSGKAGQVRVTGSGSEWLLEADVNGDSIADLVISVTTTNGHALAAGDIWF
jgi:Ca2+-binding RTX toxin-like protein